MPAPSATNRAQAKTAVRLAMGGGLVATMLISAPSTGTATAGATRTQAAATTQGSDGLAVTATPIAPVAAGTRSKAGSAASVTSAEGLETPSGSKLVAYVKRDSVAGFAMYGVTWDHASGGGDVTVQIRALADGTWTDWSELETDHDGGPTSSAEDSDYRDGTEPAWVGDATGIEVAVFGTGKAPAGLQVDTIDPGADPATSTATSTASTKSKAGGDGGYLRTPAIISRRQWGADPSLGDTCWAPRIGRTFKAVIVHHTAGSNDYSARDGKALVRGIYAYHTQSRGWCDIGYNFLIDKFGRVYEGRAGGIHRAVRGAHAGDYNVDTTGISLMGNFDVTRPTTRMKNALVRLTAWRLGTAYHGAYGKPFLYDGRFNRISGHRDVMSTACPGRYVYDWLPTLRKRVERRVDSYESPIERYWRSNAGQKRDLGTVRIGEQIDGRGRYTLFQRGAVYASGAGRFVLDKGPVLARYRALGQTASYLRYPKSNIAKAGGSGSQVRFEGGWIYWSKATGARDLYRGTVLAKYRKLGAASGRLGFPTRSIRRTDDGAIGRFQHGTITFDSATKRTTVSYR